MNQIEFHRTRSPWLMFLEEFKELFPLLLMAAALLAFFAHHLSPNEGYDLIGAALLVVVVLNAVVSFVQNYKVEQLMLSFLNYIPKEVTLLRGGEKVLLDAKEVVPGDILNIQEGDKIPADDVFIDTAQLLLDESILTGESEPVSRGELGEMVEENFLARSGAIVLKGNARVLVTHTGRSTSLGSISALSQSVERDLMPMQLALQNFVHKFTYLALGIGLLFFLIGLAISNTFWTNLIFAIGIIVANVPEGLLPTVTLALTQASVRMGKNNAVIKHILSVETLGSTTVICTDKTGTLTLNSLHVEKFYLDMQEVDAEHRKSAGIRIIVMRGDKGETVSYIARKLGITTAPKVIEGEQLQAMDSEELIQELRGGKVVFARISPKQKLAIVDAFKEMDEVIAVTGDGVNDAPSLKRADIGIAMGQRGTDVAKIDIPDTVASIKAQIEADASLSPYCNRSTPPIMSSRCTLTVPHCLPASTPRRQWKSARWWTSNFGAWSPNTRHRCCSMKRGSASSRPFPKA